MAARHRPRRHRHPDRGGAASSPPKDSTKRDLGREEFEARVWKWKEENGGRIVEQMKRVGASCDWSRERFTLDPGLSRAVREAFVRLYEKGLIYRGDYMVNWCPRCQTALSDLEVEHEESEGSLWHIRYPVMGLTMKTSIVATTRPETMLGDTGVAINPMDPRAAHLHRHNAELPLMDREIPIVLDDMADPEFGTGAVKITPAHDPNDFEAGKRHDLPGIQGDRRRRQDDGGGGASSLDWTAMKRASALSRILQALGLLEKIEPYKLNVGKCHRCKTVVEPLVSKQWFVKMKPLADAGHRRGGGRPHRRSFPRTGRRPISSGCTTSATGASRASCGGAIAFPRGIAAIATRVIVAREDSADMRALRLGRTQAGSRCARYLVQFRPVAVFDAGLAGQDRRSAALLSDDAADHGLRHHLLLGRAHDHAGHARCMGDVPFRQVYIHGLVRDADRQKMSKTKGNVIDPLVVNDKYGTDAVRFGLLVAAAPGNDIAFSEEVILRGRNFANKIWNASGLLFSKLPYEPKRESLADRWIGSRLNSAIDKANRAFEHHRYHEAADAVWTFFWDEFCDWYLELKKSDTDWGFAYQVHEKAMLLLHPLMPFITEELWHRRGHETSIALEAYPQYEPALNDPDAEREMKLLQEIVTAIRESRADHKIDRKMKLSGRVSLAGSVPIETIERLTNVSLEVLPRQASGFDLELHLPEAAGASGEQKDRLKKDNEQVEKVIANSLRQLGNDSFVSKAPAHVIDGMRAKLAEYQAQLAKNQAVLSE